MKFSIAMQKHCPICNNIDNLSIRLNNLVGIQRGLNSDLIKFRTSLRSLNGNRIISNIEYHLDTINDDMSINFLDEFNNYKSVISINLINLFKEYNFNSKKNILHGECLSCKEYRFRSNEFALSLKENNLYIEREIFDFKYDNKSYYINNYPMQKNTHMTVYDIQNLSSKTTIMPLLPFCNKIKYCNKLKLLLPFF